MTLIFGSSLSEKKKIILWYCLCLLISRFRESTVSAGHGSSHSGSDQKSVYSCERSLWEFMKHLWYFSWVLLSSNYFMFWLLQLEKSAMNLEILKGFLWYKCLLSPLKSICSFSCENEISHFYLSCENRDWVTPRKSLCADTSCAKRNNRSIALHFSRIVLILVCDNICTIFKISLN